MNTLETWERFQMATLANIKKLGAVAGIHTDTVPIQWFCTSRIMHVRVIKDKT